MVALRICTCCAPVNPKSPSHKYWTFTWTGSCVESVIVKWAVSPSVTEALSAVIDTVRSRVLAVAVEDQLLAPSVLWAAPVRRIRC